MSEQRDDPVEPDVEREPVDPEAPAVGVIDEDVEDPPEPNEPA